MTRSYQVEAWQQLSDILSAHEPPHGVLRTFPVADATPLSLLEALGSEQVAATVEHGRKGKALHLAMQGLVQQLAVFSQISRCPILAITGLLNAGKSSLLASYLSPVNRRRVLRGLANDAGTHRFVIWLPEIWWSDAELLNTMIGFLTSIFGHPPEQLSDDPIQAGLQYNGHILSDALMHPQPATNAAQPATVTTPTPITSPLSVPLIAYDAGLDALKVGLVDCPDIQTGILGNSSSRGDELANLRREQLGRIGRLCSAFIVLCKLNSLHDDGLLQVLTTLRDAMPGVPRLLAVNKVKARYAPETVYQQARALCERFGLSDVYAAYDFRSSLAESRIPPRPSQMLDGDDLPIFFRTNESAVRSDPVQYLHDLGDRLDVGTLSRESSRSLVLQLQAKTNQALDWFEKNDQLQATRIADAWKSVADACYEFMAERDATGRTTGLRLQTSPAIIAQMADSLQRNAPLWMRVSLSIDRTARQLQQAVANSAARIKILQGASKSVAQFAKRFRRGEGAQVVTPQRLADAIRSADVHDAFEGCSGDQLVVDCESAMKRFAAEDTTRLDEQELDTWSREVWKAMSFKDKLWKGTQPLAVVMAPLLAAVLVPIDGGGSAVLVFASTKELLAAAGLAAAMGPIFTGGEALGIVQRESPWRQLSDLFAIACDALGLPRPDADRLPTATCNGVERRLLSSKLETKQKSGSPAVSVWRAGDELIRGIQAALQQLP